MNSAQMCRSAERDRWKAVLGKDKMQDGSFYYSVRTTGVYCRPSCAARRPRRENVEFHATRDDAERAGFRPCKRCRPDAPALSERQATVVTEACRFIATAETMPSLDALAARAGLSRFHFARLFKARTGLSPREYAAGVRAQRVRDELPRAQTVTEAIYDAGFNSSAPFYATSVRTLGMRPRSFRAGGEGASIRFALGTCSLGSILIAATDKGVCAILLGDEPEALVHELRDRFPKAQVAGGERAFEALVEQVIGFVEAPAVGLDLPLDVRGTAFQQRVWNALREIPLGSTASYAELASRIGAPTATRAVARACASNAIALAIPCHRAVRRDGGFAGYRWGLARKRALLERERGRGTSGL